MVLPFDDETDLIAQANTLDFGLAVGVWSSDDRKILRVARAVRADTEWINTCKEGSRANGFGGVKQSKAASPAKMALRDYAPIASRMVWSGSLATERVGVLDPVGCKSIQMNNHQRRKGTMATTVEVLANAIQAAGTLFIVDHPDGASVALIEAARRRDMRFILMQQDVAVGRAGSHRRRRSDRIAGHMPLYPRPGDCGHGERAGSCSVGQRAADRHYRPLFNARHDTGLCQRIEQLVLMAARIDSLGDVARLNALREN